MSFTIFESFILDTIFLKRKVLPLIRTYIHINPELLKIQANELKILDTIESKFKNTLLKLYPWDSEYWTSTPGNITLIGLLINGVIQQNIEKDKRYRKYTFK